MNELDPRIRIRAALRCDGIGRLDCAEDAESGGRLAVRWLPLDANGDAAVKACAKLPEHPMLPRIRQTGQVGTSAFVAMDFPDGALLSTRAGERLEVDQVIQLGAQLSDALATVHAQGVVHGEMSTDSVLLVEPNHAYLWDMPLVIANRLTDRRGENRLMQNLVKTAPFLAPERARGEGASQASDVYALGAVLCAAAGAPLPVASTPLGVVHLVATGEWTPRVPMVLPDPYRSMLARMVSADPASRPTAREAADVFGELPPPAALPTVPEFPVVKLPPELLAAADALLRRPSMETPAVPADPERSRENPVLDVAAEAKAESARPHEPADDGTADTVKRGAVPAKPSASGPQSRKAVEQQVAEAKPATSAPSLQPVATQAQTRTEPRTETGSNTEKAAEAKATTSGPTTRKAVDEKLGEKLGEKAAEAKASTSGPALQKAVEETLAEKADRSGPTSRQAVAQVAAQVAVAGAAVQLTDTISVAHELAQAGAMTLSAEEVEALHRSRRQVILVAAGLGGAILALLLAAFVLASSRAPATVVVPSPRPASVEPAKAAVPVKAAADEDELAPLPKLPPLAPKAAAPVKPAPAKAAPVAKQAAVESPAAPSAPANEASEAADTVTPAPTAASDFEFLDSSAEAPSSELKRPSW